MNESENENSPGGEWTAEQARQQAGRIASADQARMYATFYQTLTENGVRPNHAVKITCEYLRVLNKNMRGSN